MRSSTSADGTAPSRKIFGSAPVRSTTVEGPGSSPPSTRTAASRSRPAHRRAGSDRVHRGGSRSSQRPPRPARRSPEPLPRARERARRCVCAARPASQLYRRAGFGKISVSGPGRRARKSASSSSGTRPIACRRRRRVALSADFRPAPSAGVERWPGVWFRAETVDGVGGKTTGLPASIASTASSTRRSSIDDSLPSGEILPDPDVLITQPVEQRRHVARVPSAVSRTSGAPGARRGGAFGDRLCRTLRDERPARLVPATSGSRPTTSSSFT